MSRTVAQFDEGMTRPDAQATEPGASAAFASDLRSHVLGPMLVRASRVRSFVDRCIALSFRLEGGQYWSRSAREIMQTRFGVHIGAYSYGPCFVPGAFPRGVVIGRYVSIANGVCAFARNHPMDRLSTHPFFFNSLMGMVPKDEVETGSLVIGDDAWLGANAILTPGCSRIGIGAVVGAGSIVTRDVPDFAVVVGNPAKLIRYRFDEATRKVVLASRWWERPVAACREELGSMTIPLRDPMSHPLLGRAAGAIPRQGEGTR